MSSGVACGGSVAALSLTQKHAPNAAATTSDRLTLCNGKLDGPPPETSNERAAIDPDARAKAERIIRAFNTWAFKREQPSDTQLMLRTIGDSVAAREPIRFVLYWGKGPRREVCAPEAQCLNFLGALASRVAAVYGPGTALTLILTDTHAELNGHSRDEIRHYFEEVTTAAQQRGFDTCWLGPMVRAAGALAAAAPLEAAVSEDTLSRLTASAQKWYRGPSTAQEGALTYLRMNLIEQRVVERAFPRAIFITFNGSGLRALFPRQLPIFYMYSLRRGVSVKPWFLPSESQTLERGTNQTESSHPDAA